MPYGEACAAVDHECHCGKKAEASYWCSNCKRVFSYCSAAHERKAVRDWANCCYGRIRSMLENDR